ncbi:MAG: SprB repeat-containing protein, partial [Bacteroidota bacterium]
MKNTFTLFRVLCVALLSALLPGSGLAQAPTCALLITNDAQVAPNEYQFDVYLISTGASTFEMAGHQLGFNYNSAIKNGGTMTASWVAGSTQLTNPAQLQATINTTNNPSQMRIASPAAPGAGNGSIIATGVLSPFSGGTRIGRLRMINSIPFAVLQPNISISVLSSTSSTRSGVNVYFNLTNLPLCINGVVGNPATNCIGTITMNNTLSNPVLNTPSCTSPTLSASVSNATCLGLSNGAIDLTTTGGSPTPFTYLWSNGATTQDLSGLAAGTYTVTVTTNTGGCTASASYTVNDGPAPQNSFTSISACGSYTWAINGTTYTQSGLYFNTGSCGTDSLNLTITPSVVDTLTIIACDSYTWAQTGITYTQTGFYSTTIACTTNVLNL